MHPIAAVLHHTLYSTHSHADRNSHCTAMCRANKNRKKTFLAVQTHKCAVTWLPSWLHPETGSLWRCWRPFRGCWGGPGRCGWRCSTASHSHKPARLLCTWERCDTGQVQALNAGSQQMRGHFSIFYCGDSSCSVLSNFFLLENQIPGTLLLKHIPF